jgi:type IV pilus assembly protein PilM
MGKAVVAFDAGSSLLKMAVFAAERNRLQLVDFDVSPISVPPEASLEEKNRILARQMKTSLSLKKVKSGKILVGMSGQSVFTRFVKLPAVEESKVAQIIRYEAQQQVPFPIEDVEWDHNIIGKTASGEIDIVLVAVKNDVISSFTQECRKAGLDVSVIDAAPLAVYNCLRHAEQDFAECTAVIDFGAKSADLIISEGDDLWARTIPIGGDSITAAIAKELNLDEAQAEKLKQASWVPGTSAGEPPDATEEQRRASSVIASFVSRMYAELSRSIGFYRSQAGHSAVRRILLSGGSCRLRNFKESLSDKLKIDVGWLSPLNRIGIAPGIDRTELNRYSDLLAGAVGLGLRGAEMGRIRINLLPKSIARQRELARKKVLLVTSGWLLVAALLMMALGKKMAHGDNSRVFNNIVRTVGKVVPGVLPGGSTLKDEKEELQLIYQRDDAKSGEIKKIQGEIQEVEKKVDDIADLQSARLHWAQLIEELKKTKVKAAGKGQRNHIWLTALLITNSRMAASDYIPELETIDGDTTSLYSYRRGTFMSSSRQTTRKKTSSTTDTRPYVIITGYVKIPPEVSGQESARFYAKAVEDFKNALETMGETFACKEHRFREDVNTGILLPVSADAGPAKAYRYRWDESASKLILEGLEEEVKKEAKEETKEEGKAEATDEGKKDEKELTTEKEVKEKPEGAGQEAAEGEKKEEKEESLLEGNWKLLAEQKMKKKPEWINEGPIKGNEIPCPIEMARATTGKGRPPNATRTGGYLEEVHPRGFEEPLPGERVGRFTMEGRLAEEFYYAKKSELGATR